MLCLVVRPCVAVTSTPPVPYAAAPRAAGRPQSPQLPGPSRCSRARQAPRPPKQRIPVLANAACRNPVRLSTPVCVLLPLQAPRPQPSLPSAPQSKPPAPSPRRPAPPCLHPPLAAPPQPATPSHLHRAARKGMHPLAGGPRVTRPPWRAHEVGGAQGAGMAAAAVAARARPAATGLSPSPGPPRRGCAGLRAAWGRRMGFSAPPEPAESACCGASVLPRAQIVPCEGLRACWRFGRQPAYNSNRHHPRFDPPPPLPAALHGGRALAAAQGVVGAPRSEPRPA
jgi:hypothetical protein